MTSPARTSFAALTACAAFFVTHARAAGADRSAIALLPPETVVGEYEYEMGRVVTPRIVRFEYAVEQVGPHNLSQTHRLYRSGLTERDEILSVDGQPLPMPSIRIIRNRVNRYNIMSLAPRFRDYTFSYVGVHREGPQLDYVFTTTPRGTLASPYRVVAVGIDGTHFLPRTISYVAVNGKVRGRGTLTFWRQDKYWVIAQATATARIDGKVARERLVFHNYDFPPSLPDSTFTEPRPLTTPPPTL